MNYNEAILFIDIVNENDKFQFKLTQQAEEILMQLQDKIICVVGIAGPQRTGKSFLCNTLINQMDGFSLGNTTLPCTKGIWIWGRPLIIDNQAILILDTEGLHSVFRDKKVDSYILGITLLLCSVFVYNNFGVIDEKELNELTSVIELTRWVKEGNIIPYFLWCLRDFVLDATAYENSDDYMENCLAVKDFDVKSDKYKMRKTFKSFFKDRGCLFFVRPMNDEKKVRTLEQQQLGDLRIEFREAVNLFKERVHHKLKPKRYNGQVLNGTSFMLLIKDILDAFNNKKIPEVKNSIERVLEQERKLLKQNLISFVEDHIKQNIEKDNVFQIGVQLLWEKIQEECKKLQNFELGAQLFSEVLKIFEDKLKYEKDQNISQKLQNFNEKINEIIQQEKVENILDAIKDQIKKDDMQDYKFEQDFVIKKILERIFKKVDMEQKQTNINFQDQLDDLQKDLQAEKEKKQNQEIHFQKQKKILQEYKLKIEQHQTTLDTKTNEILNLRNILNEDQTLMKQLGLYQEKVAKLEKENEELKRGNKYSNEMLQSEIQQSVLNPGTQINASIMNKLQDINLTMDNGMNLKEFFENLQDMLMEKVEQLELQNDELKLQVQESQDKDQIIQKLKSDLVQLKKNKQSSNDLDVQLYKAIAENKKLQAEKMNFFDVITQIIKSIKKKKNSNIKNALSMLIEEDRNEVEKILTEYKIKFQLFKKYFYYLINFLLL